MNGENAKCTVDAKVFYMVNCHGLYFFVHN